MNIAAEASASTAHRRSVRSVRRWLFRAAAVFCGFSPFILLELICRAVGWGAADPGVDPFVGFAESRPLFTLSADKTTYHTAPERLGFFKEVSFSAQKPAGEFRIFVFGGSTVQGNPFSIETSFPAWLQLALEQAVPDRRWNVVNCGGVSYASYRLVPVMRECLQYQPDLYVFCEGHNEHLEDVEYASQRAVPGWLHQIAGVLGQLRIVRLLQSLNAPGRPAQRAVAPSAQTDLDQSLRDPDGRPVLPAEVTTLLNFSGGLDAYRRDDAHAAIVAAHFRSNLQRMVALSNTAEVPLLFVLPPSNLADCPPFKSEHSPGLTAEQQIRTDSLLKQARELSASDLPSAITRCKAAVAEDPRYALAWYELGRHQFAAGDFAAAESSLRRARDEDICPLRITSPLESALIETATQTGTPLLDAQKLLAARSLHGIVDGSVLVDHVHPSFRGHEDIAIAIADWMLQAGLFATPVPGWQERTHSECARRLQELDDLYFLRGRRALEDLRLWAAGRSGGPPLPDHMRPK